MTLPVNLITGRTSSMPGDYKKQPNNQKQGSGLEEGFLRLWRSVCGELQEPVREFRFHPTRKWRFDFAWPNVKLAVEIDGMARGGGRHQRYAGFTRDAEKGRAATELDWQVLHFTGDDLRSSPVQSVELVAKILKGMQENENTRMPETDSL